MYAATKSPSALSNISNKQNGVIPKSTIQNNNNKLKSQSLSKKPKLIEDHTSKNNHMTKKSSSPSRKTVNPSDSVVVTGKTAFSEKKRVANKTAGAKPKTPLPNLRPLPKRSASTGRVETSANHSSRIGTGCLKETESHNGVHTKQEAIEALNYEIAHLEEIVDEWDILDNELKDTHHYFAHNVNSYRNDSVTESNCSPPLAPALRHDSMEKHSVANNTQEHSLDKRPAANITHHVNPTISPLQHNSKPTSRQGSLHSSDDKPKRVPLKAPHNLSDARQSDEWATLDHEIHDDRHEFVPPPKERTPEDEEPLMSLDSIIEAAKRKSTTKIDYQLLITKNKEKHDRRRASSIKDEVLSEGSLTDDDDDDEIQH